jgi:hypothetical protein
VGLHEHDRADPPSDDRRGDCGGHAAQHDREGDRGHELRVGRAGGEPEQGDADRDPQEPDERAERGRRCQAPGRGPEPALQPLESLTSGMAV